MKSEILKLLKNSEGYLSGQQLCERYNVSRTAVWKAIEQLKSEGYEIEAVRNKGYRLLKSPPVMSKAELESITETSWAGRTVVYLKETDSTNTQAKALGEKQGVHGTLLVAEKQNAGKGRRGRMWESPAETSIYMTILLRPSISSATAPMLTLVMALSVVEGIRDSTGIETGIKWPNDIVTDAKKVCGILTEMSADMDGVHYVVIGAGINVNQDRFPEELKEKATSLCIKKGTSISRPKLIASIMKRFEYNYGQFIAAGDLSSIMDAYNEALVNCKKKVRILEPGNEYDAFALGINRQGELLVRKQEGELTTVFAGEVSVRGIYGYV